MYAGFPRQTLDWFESLPNRSDILHICARRTGTGSSRKHNYEPMDTLNPVKKILRDTLNLGTRADRLTADSPLLGGLPEFDSMAVVSVVAALEDEFGISVNDDELSAEVFATVGSLTQFVSSKLE